jgi:hypothetical protein
MELQEMFVYFAAKFDQLPTPKSVAEAKITADELAFLTQWFSALYGKPRTWCDRDWQEVLTENTTASSREMFGALFLILAGEICRDRCGEDAVWPAVSLVLKADSVSFPTLFVGGQPTPACKVAMAAGARRLGLRNLIDRYGTQEYFDTLKLQFGFTLQGGRKRLSDWLDGLPSPIAVSILRGNEEEYTDLQSESFRRLWKTLSEFRRGRVPEAYAMAALQESPWIRPSWTVEVLQAARRPASRPVVVRAAVESKNDFSEPICEATLRWEYPSKPRLSLQLNEDRIQELLVETNVAVFSVDGRVVSRWIAQAGGLWSGLRAIPCEPESAKAKPNLRPKILSISSDEGKQIAEINLFDEGLGDPLLLFDVKNDSAVDLASTLDVQKDYALLCESDLTVTGCDQCLTLNQCCVYRLKSPWPRDLKVLCEGAIYWQPKIADVHPELPMKLTLASPEGMVSEIETATQIIINGLPEDARTVTLIVGTSSYEAKKIGDYWQTEKAVRISLRLALSEERVRIRVSCGDSVRTVTPRSTLSLSGLASIDLDSGNESQFRWNLVDRNRPLNLAGGTSRARIFVAATKPELYEGPRLVNKISSRTLPFRDLFGWGWPLLVSSHDAPTSALVDCVEDRGCVGLYIQSLLGRSVNKVHLRIPIHPSKDHVVFVWHAIDSPAKEIGGESLTSDLDGFVWKLPDLGQVAAMAIAYRGVWLGSHSNAELASQALHRSPSARVFALARWLKLPVMSAALRNSMEKATTRAPAEFVRGWLNRESLPPSLTFRQPDPGAEAIIRWFLWNHREENQDRIVRIARAFPGPQSSSEAEIFMSSLVGLGEICPPLAYNVAKARLRGDKYWQYIRRVVAQVLRQPSTASLSHLNDSLRTLTRQCSDLLRVTPETLVEQVNALVGHLDSQPSAYAEMESQLRRMGELSVGRQQLTASLLIRILERSKP